MADAPDAARYHALQLRLMLAGIVLDVVFLGGMAWTRGAAALARRAASLTPRWWLALAMVALALGAMGGALRFPLAWLRGYRLPRRYGLLHQPLVGWLADRMKAAVLSGVFALVVVEVIYALLRRTSYWWLAAAAIVWAASLAVATVFPVWIVPLFYRVTPLGDDRLRGRLLALARHVGLRPIGVFVVDQSRKARTANAAVTGFGRTRRILLFDTLVARFTAEEIESVLAHELAHHAHGDLWRGVAIQGVITVVTFWVADRVLVATAPALGLSSLADPAGLPWLVLVLGAAGVLALPVVNALSRRMERRADEAALTMTGNPDAFVAAMERLGALNLAERRPSRWKQIVLASHPALEQRIAHARAFGRAR